MQMSVYAWPSGASSLVSDLDRFGDPATQPLGFPPPPTRGLPPRSSRVPRVNEHTATLPHVNTEALFQSPKLLAQILSESQAAKPQKNEKPCPSLRDRHPVLARLTRAALAAHIRNSIPVWSSRDGARRTARKRDLSMLEECFFNFFLLLFLCKQL